MQARVGDGPPGLKQVRPVRSFDCSMTLWPLKFALD